MDEAIIWLLVILLVLIIAVVAFALVRSRNRSRLRQRFGPEYDREVERTGDRRAAEQRLAAVADRRDALPIRDPTPEETARWTAEWQGVQARFVDAPAEAVAAADSMLTEVLRSRGYPIQDFDDRASLVALDHPDVVEHYRSAHDAHERHRQSGSADTEDLRQAFVHYRELFTSLVGARSAGAEVGGPLPGARTAQPGETDPLSGRATDPEPPAPRQPGTPR